MWVCIVVREKKKESKGDTYKQVAVKRKEKKDGPDFENDWQP